MLLKNKLGYELADSLHVQKLDDIDLVVELLRGVLVSLESLHSSLEPACFAEEAATPLA